MALTLASGVGLVLGTVCFPGSTQCDPFITMHLKLDMGRFAGPSLRLTLLKTTTSKYISAIAEFQEADQ